MGRYIESDPSGLGGGINTYAYAIENPVTWSDQLGLKPGDLFPSSNPGALQAAAVDALDWIYRTYPNTNYEYAGTVYLDKQGNYVATEPKTLGLPRQSSPSHPPIGIPVAALYHTHGQCTKGVDNDNFSHKTRDEPRSDKWLADAYQVPSFLETPVGKILRYDFDPKNQEGGNVTVIRNGCSCPN